MGNLNTSTVAEIVANDYRTAEIFKSHGIDFCCGGKKTILAVCSERNLNAGELEKEILALQNNPTNSGHNFNEWSLTFLADYILNVHHSYVKSNLNLISEFAEKVARVHGDHNPETKDIARLWEDVVNELSTHMKKEEVLLFPYIKTMEQGRLENLKQLPQPNFGSVKNPISMMEHEHDIAGNLMKQIQVLSSSFTVPDYACNTYRVLYAKLKEFQNDLFQHIHLENNILFPKAILLEGTFISATDQVAL